MMDYYAFYELPEAYHLDMVALKERFMAKSRALHPDFHTQADAATQAQMLTLSSLNNQAWRTLSHPQLRLQYLLQRYGLLDAEGANRSGVDLPAAFLMEVMDLNEALLDAPDAARQTIATLQAQAQERLNQALQAFDGAPTPEARLAALRQAMTPYLQLRYLQRMAA